MSQLLVHPPLGGSGGSPGFKPQLSWLLNSRKSPRLILTTARASATTRGLTSATSATSSSHLLSPRRWCPTTDPRPFPQAIQTELMIFLPKPFPPPIPSISNKQKASPQLKLYIWKSFSVSPSPSESPLGLVVSLHPTPSPLTGPHRPLLLSFTGTTEAES